MKSIKQYITEFVNVNNIKKNEHKYYPKTKDELIKAIETELNKGNTNLNCIDTSEITDMERLFDYVHGIKLTDEQQENLDISEWNVSNVTNMHGLFGDCKHFNCDLSKWDVSNVTDMMFMFYNCYQFNNDLSNWDVSNVEEAEHMFWNCKKFNCDLESWNIVKLAYNDNMFTNSGLNNNEPSWYK